MARYARQIFGKLTHTFFCASQYQPLERNNVLKTCGCSMYTVNVTKCLRAQVHCLICLSHSAQYPISRLLYSCIFTQDPRLICTRAAILNTCVFAGKKGVSSWYVVCRVYSIGSYTARISLPPAVCVLQVLRD